MAFAPRDIGPALCRVLGLDESTVSDIVLHCSADDVPTAYVKRYLTDPARIEEELWFLRADRQQQRVRRKMRVRTAEDLADRAQLVLDGWTIEIAGRSESRP